MYYVIGDGGAKFGPADVPTLKQWVTEGRVLPTTMLEDAVTGLVSAASENPELFPPAGAATTSVPGPGQPLDPPSTTTSGTTSSPYGSPVSGPTSYQSPPNTGSPYHRPSNSSADGNKMNTMAIAFGAASLIGCIPCCCLGYLGSIPGLLLGGASLYFCTKAKEQGFNTTLPMILAIAGIVLNFGWLILLIISPSMADQWRSSLPNR